MNRETHLLQRLDAIGQSLAATGNALALLGLGSVGLELDRLDAYSDLDFFVIVKPGYKAAFLHNLDWLSTIQPIAYVFQNTIDGHKLLFEDEIFCEMAIFEPEELATIPFAAGRIVWSAPEFDPSLAAPKQAHAPAQPSSTEWLLGEALTNLYVGLARYHRGEKLSAFRFIQVYALENVLQLASQIESEKPAFVDPFARERRFEQRFPQTAAHFAQFMQGYASNRDSARAILTFLDEHFPVNAAIKKLILSLCDQA